MHLSLLSRPAIVGLVPNLRMPKVSRDRHCLLHHMPHHPTHSSGIALPAAECAVPRPPPKGDDGGRTAGQRADQTADHLHLPDAISASLLASQDGILDERAVLRARLRLQGAK